MTVFDNDRTPRPSDQTYVGGAPEGPRRRSVATILARWSTCSATTVPAMCDECGEALEAGVTHCPQCRQSVPLPSTGMLAALVETTGGDRRLVVAERTPGGGWAAARVMPATPNAVRALARQDRTRGGAA
jgi:hypothetical protein